MLMTLNFTPNDVLLNHSGELPGEVDSLLKICVQEDPELEDFSLSLLEIESGLNRMIPETDEIQVQLILSKVAALNKKDS